MFNQQKEDEAKAEVANLRLQAIFLDEPHHTYGQKVDAELKKVRKTVDYLHNPHTEIEAREAHETQRVCMVTRRGSCSASGCGMWWQRMTLLGKIKEIMGCRICT